MASNNDLHPHASVEEGDMIEKKPRQRRGLKWFIVDLWWIHLIVLAIGVVAVTLPVVYVVYPKVARSQVNSATLEIADLAITDPRPNALHINITTRLGTKSIFRPTLKPFNGTLTLPDGSAFLTLPVPVIHARNGRLTVIDTEVTLPDDRIESFTEFAKALVLNETVTSRLTGKGKLQLGKLPNTDVTYDKTLNLKGFNGLSGVTVSDLALLTTTQADGATLSGRTNIPNPSIQTVQLGDLTLNLAIPAAALSTSTDTPIGYAMINDTILRPGDNFFDVRSVANQTLVITIMLQHPSFITDGLPVLLKGKDVSYQGQTISYLTEALKSNTIRQQLNVAEAITNAGLGGIFTNNPGRKRELIQRLEERGARTRQLAKKDGGIVEGEDDLNGWATAIKNALAASGDV